MADREPEACMPCRGTGRAISNLGGEPSQVACPWCKGGGLRLTGIDAQAAWLEERAAGNGGKGAGPGGDDSPADAVA
ncbi:MAG: hypothetical protein ACHQE6_01470 [Solirubrobacterales bacterium]